jgi:UDP-N-acetylglucosamine 2-epimerase (non-hydrolysing)
MHPRTKSKLDGKELPKGLRIIDPLGFYDFSKLLKSASCVISDSGTAAEEGIFYGVPNVSLRMATERPETIESGSTIVSGMDPENILDSVITAMSVPWAVKYDFAETHSPSSVVINSIRTQITNFF